MTRVTVLGAAGGAGGAIVSELAARGHVVTASSRHGDAPCPDGVRQVATDLDDAAQVVAACADAEVVVMAANVPYASWATMLWPMVERALAGAVAAGARLVMVDNLYAYGAPDEPITDTTPEAATTRKGQLRRSVARRLLAADRDGGARVSIARFSDYYGPGGTNSLVYMLGIRRALDGRPPQAFIDADQPHTFNYLPDVARGVATLVERPDGDGRAWILPAAPPITQRELFGLVAGEAGINPRIGRISRPLLAIGGLFDRQLREVRELTGQWDRPYSTDATAFEAAFGAMVITGHEQAVAETVAWFRSAAETDCSVTETVANNAPGNH